jgi:hypothetical protein
MDEAIPAGNVRRSRFWLYTPFVLLLLAAIAWSAAWFVIRNRAGEALRRLAPGGGSRRAAMDLPGPPDRRLSLPHRDRLRRPQPEAGRRDRLLRAGGGRRADLPAPARDRGNRRPPARHRRAGERAGSMGPAPGQHSPQAGGPAAGFRRRQGSPHRHCGAGAWRDRHLGPEPRAAPAPQSLPGGGAGL